MTSILLFAIFLDFSKPIHSLKTLQFAKMAGFLKQKMRFIFRNIENPSGMPCKFLQQNSLQSSRETPIQPEVVEQIKQNRTLFEKVLQHQNWISNVLRDKPKTKATLDVAAFLTAYGTSELTCVPFEALDMLSMSTLELLNSYLELNIYEHTREIISANLTGAITAPLATYGLILHTLNRTKEGVRYTKEKATQTMETVLQKSPIIFLHKSAASDVID